MIKAPPDHQHPYEEAMCPRCESAAAWEKEHRRCEEHLTPEVIKDRLENLDSINHKVEEHDKMARTKSGVDLENTIAWLKHNKEKKKKTSGFIQSILHWFKDEPEDSGPQLPLEWAQAKLNVQWTERSYAVLNAPFHVDMTHARRIIHTGALLEAAPNVCEDFKKWMAEFYEQLNLCHKLKDELLEEKARVSNKAIRVVTQYEPLQKMFEASLNIEVATSEYGEKILEFFNEVDATLRDEMDAVSEVNPRVMTPLLENEAFSALFSGMDTTESTAIYVAKLVAWMKNALAREEFDAFMKLFSSDVRRAIADKWMQQYAEHLHRLEPFALELHCAVVYSRSRAEVVASIVDPSQP